MHFFFSADVEVGDSDFSWDDMKDLNWEKFAIEFRDKICWFDRLNGAFFFGF